MPYFKEHYLNQAIENITKIIAVLHEGEKLWEHLVLPHNADDLSVFDFFTLHAAVYPRNIDNVSVRDSQIIGKARGVADKVVCLLFPGSRMEDDADRFSAQVNRVSARIKKETLGQDVAVVGINDPDKVMDFLRITNTHAIIRTLRNIPESEQQLAYEADLARENYHHYGIETVFVLPSSEHMILPDTLTSGHLAQLRTFANATYPSTQFSSENLTFLRQFHALREQSVSMVNPKAAFYAGSFDPVTNGHMEVIARASQMFEKVYVGVGINPTKEYRFSQSERAQMLKEAIASVQLTNVEVISYDALTVDIAASYGTGTLIRGARSIKDLEDELPLAWINNILNPALTSALMTPYKYVDVSSSHVKELYDEGKNVAHLVPGSVYFRFLKQKLRTNQTSSIPIIGLTGGIASGKSTALEILKQNHDVHTIIIDDLTSTLRNRPTIVEEFVEIFGTDILDDDMHIQWGRVREIAFNAPIKLYWLTTVIYPMVFSEIEASIDLAKTMNKKAIVIEWIDLINTGFYHILDQLWLIHADEDIRLDRIRDTRPHNDMNVARNIMTMQRAFLEKAKTLADVVIDNSHDAPLLQHQLAPLLETLLSSNPDEISPVLHAA